MKINFIQKLLNQPWDIAPDRARTIMASMIHRLRDERPATSVFGEELPKMEIEDGTATIPIRGTLMLAVPDWAKELGLSITDANDITEELDLALRDSSVTAIMLDIDSPGGESCAGNKLFAAVQAAAAVKPVLAYAADGAMMCSAAYNLALPAQRIYAGPFATIGSVGSYLAILDDSEFYRMMGITVEVFRSGDLKGLGEDALTDPQRAWLQSIVDKSGAKFRANVTSYRTAIDPANLQGQWFDGEDAAALGFIHGLAKDDDAALEQFRAIQ
jgi:capsid assembly protease